MKQITFGLILLLIAFTLGCSGGNLPTSPADTSTRDAASGSTHMLWGMWQFTADPLVKTLDFVPLRVADMHLNALPFLEPPPLLNLTLESLEFNGNIIEADIGLRHPFLGLNEFTGFDVCGILISRGSISGFTDPDILLPGPDDLHLLNPDGFTRWWNPAEFPVNNGTIFSYKDGLLGTPQSTGEYNATLNGYKYFCDEFTSPDSPMSDIDPTGRGIFGAGQKNVRHYSIQIGDSGLIFNYAVDANWVFPSGPPPWQVPDDFPPVANRPEAWNITVEVVENTLWNDGVDSGGDLSLSIDVYDWYNAGSNLVTVESLDNFTAAEDVTPTGSGVGYSTYQVDIISATPAQDAIDLLITVKSDMSGYGGLLPGKAQASYFMTSVPVDDEAPPVEEDPYGWWCFQYNAPNYGRNTHPQSFDPSDYIQKSYCADFGRKYTGPAVTENYVYVVTNPDGVYTSTNYHITCFAIADGSIAWQKYINPQNEYRRGLASPTYFEVDGQGRIAVGGDRLYCFDAVTGVQIWTYREDLSFISTSVKVVDSRIYAAAGGAIHCVDAESGAEIWVSDPDITGGEFIPAVADGKVYCNWDVYWTCLDAIDGSQIWRVNTGSTADHWIAPLVIGGRLYYCSYWQEFVCLDIADGDKVWEYNEPGSGYDNVWMTAMTYWVDPSDGNRVIYFGGAYGAGVHAVKDLGDSPYLLWRVTNGIYADSSPTYCDGIIYVGDRATYGLRGFDVATGTQVFYQPTAGGVASAAAFAYGRLVVPDENGVYVYETP